MPLIAGDEAPIISLPDEKGIIRNSKDLRNKNLVLFFYPKDDTPGCTAEACGFRDNYDLFKIFGAEVWGVSSDNKESHLKFIKKNKLPFPLLIDSSNELRNKFGVPKALGILPGRVTYVIDKKNIIRYVFNNLLNSPAHINEALRILEEIKADK
tara:strand:- start:931 stop:1392 length:462 start_codon:yes stop_codon:yes gene_type:complete